MCLTRFLAALAAHGLEVAWQRVATAHRLAVAMRRPARWCPHPGAAATLIVATLAGCGGDESKVVLPPETGPTTADGGSDRCGIGGKSSEPGPGGTEILVLACGRLPNGRGLQVTGYRESRGAGGRLWTGVWVPPRGPSFSGTGDRPLPGRAIEIQGYGILDGTKILVAGKTSRTVRAVAARLGPNARSERRRAGLVRIARPQLLRRLRLNRPVGYYFVVVPTKALRSPGNVVIEARDRRNRLLDKEVARAPDVIR